MACENYIYSFKKNYNYIMNLSMRSQLRHDYVVSCKHWYIILQFFHSGWFVLKIVKRCLNLSMLRLKTISPFFSGTRCSHCTGADDGIGVLNLRNARAYPAWGELMTVHIGIVCQRLCNHYLQKWKSKKSPKSTRLRRNCSRFGCCFWCIHTSNF